MRVASSVSAVASMLFVPETFQGKKVGLVQLLGVGLLVCSKGPASKTIGDTPASLFVCKTDGTTPTLKFMEASLFTHSDRFAPPWGTAGSGP